MHFNGRLLVLGIMTFIPVNHAKELSVSEVDLTIKPMVCMAKQHEQSCQMTITAAWQSSKPLSLCLFQNDVELACWRQQQVAQQQFDVALKEDMLFQLKDRQGKVMASQPIKVNIANSAKYRKRLRAQWSLF